MVVCHINNIVLFCEKEKNVYFCTLIDYIENNKTN